MKPSVLSQKTIESRNRKAWNMHKEKNNKRLFFSAFFTLLGVFAIAGIAL